MTATIKIADHENDIAYGSVTGSCIHDLEVYEHYRNQGYGRKLLKALIQLGGNWMWVSADNQAAISLYRSLGFKVMETDDGWYRMQLNIH